MDKDNNARGGLPPRQMFQGDWKCAECGTAITELPFEPSPDQPIRCRDCWMKQKEQ